MQDAVATPPTPLLRNYNFVALWLGQLVSVTGTNVSGIAFPLLVLVLTHSPLQAGLVGALERVPFLIIALPAGALVDRWNRKRVMVVCDTARALAFACIPLAAATGHLDMPLVYFVVLAEGLGFAFFNLAEVSVLPQVVDTSQLAQASAANQVMWAVGSLAGSPLGGLLYGIRRSLPFAADAVSYAASVLSILAIRRPLLPEGRVAGGSIRSEVGEGLRWLWNHRLIRAIGALSAFMGVVYGGVPLAVIVLARGEFHASPAAIGIVFGVATVGGLAGAAFGSWAQGKMSLAHALLAGMWGNAVFLPVLALGPNLTAEGVVAALLFFVSPLFDIAQFSYRVSQIPDRLQGRVNSIYRVLLFGGGPVGQLGAGVIIQEWGPRAALGLMGAGMILVAIAATLNEDVRHARR